MWKALIKNRFFILALIIVVVLAIVGPILPRYYTQLLTLTLITALFATSLNIEIGYAGMMPLGQATFYGVGAYSFGLLVIKAASAYISGHNMWTTNIYDNKRNYWLPLYKA